MALSDERLNAKLCHYLEKFGREWSFDRLATLDGEMHHEYEHDDEPEHPDFVQVHLTVLEHVQTGDENYVHAMVDISDNRRGFGVGSAYRSLCGGLAFHADGRVEIFPPKGRE